MAVLPFAVSLYAKTIYLYGTQRLTARDGYTGLKEEYYTPVEQFAANCAVNNPLLIGIKHIKAALSKGYINQKEYDETMAMIPADVVAAYEAANPTPVTTNDAEDLAWENEVAKTETTT